MQCFRIRDVEVFPDYRKAVVLVHGRTIAMARTSYGCDCDHVHSKDHEVQVKVQWIVDTLK